MAATDVSDFSAVLKTLYSPDAIEDLTLPESPLLGLMKKDDTFAGNDFKELVEYGDIKGTGADFTKALAAVAGTDDVAFTLTRKKHYAFAEITGELIEASRAGQRAAFVAALKRQMDSAASRFAKDLSMILYSNGYMARTTIKSTSSGVTLICENIDDVCRFEKGMKLVCAASDTSVLRSATTRTITAINRDTGALTMSDTLSGLSWTSGDSVYLDADTDATAGAAQTTGGISPCGLAGWLPSSAPSSAAFFGVDRSVDVNRLGGIRYDGSSKNIAEAVIGGAYRAARDGAHIDHYFLPYSNFEDLVNLLGSKVQYVTETAYKNPTIGFEGVKVIGPKGPIVVMPDQYCPANVAYGLTLKTWTLRSLNGVPHILDLDSQDLLRKASEDAYQIRWGAYFQIGCSAPGYNVRVALA